MNAAEIMDSLKMRQAIDKFTGTWRYKKAKEKEREAALQAFLDLLPMNQVKVETRVIPPAISILDVPREMPQVEPPPSLDLSNMSEDARRAFDLDEPIVARPQSEDERKQAILDAVKARQDQAKSLLPQVALGRKQDVYFPHDFPVQDLPAYLNGTGFAVTGKIPEDLAKTYKVRQFQAEKGDANKIGMYTGPKDGWLVEMIRVS